MIDVLHAFALIGGGVFFAVAVALILLGIAARYFTKNWR